MIPKQDVIDSIKDVIEYLDEIIEELSQKPKGEQAIDFGELKRHQLTEVQDLRKFLRELGEYTADQYAKEVKKKFLEETEEHEPRLLAV